MPSIFQDPVTRQVFTRLDDFQRRIRAIEINLRGRETLTKDRTYYVRPDGADTNSGLSNTASGGLLTVQRAIDIVCNGLDLNGFAVTIQLANGTYNISSDILLKRPIGLGSVSVIGNLNSPGNVVINSTHANANNISNTRGGGEWLLRGFRLTAGGTGSKIAIATRHHAQTFFGNIEFGSGFSIHLLASRHGQIHADYDYLVSAGAAQHAYAADYGLIYCQGRTLTISNTPAFSSQFVYANSGKAHFGGCTFSGAATGVRYLAERGGIIDVAGGSSTFLPGNSAGSVSSGGQYA